jgi:signal transduction histidine kinase
MDDITEDIARTRALRQSEASLRVATQDLARSNRALAEFASVASHDLREPLRKIRAFGDRLQRREGASLSEDGRSDLGRMVEAAERLQAMISDMLDLARLPTGERVQRLTPLATLATEAIADLSEAIAASGASVEVGPLPTTLVDPIQMRRVFQNLIGNALKFQAPGVPPRVTVGAGEPFLQEDGTAAVEVWVQDEGIGIDERFADRIFQPFERLHGRDEYEGTGMGLAICRTILELHGGTIRASGDVGVGTRITLTLPLRAEALPPREVRA